jgi:WXG100 family type VII secretion target
MTGSGDALNTDLDAMRTVATSTDNRSDEIRTLLQGFIARMDAVPASVWGGFAASRFKEIVQRWNTESIKLTQALRGIADSIRQSERELRAAAQAHAQRIIGAGADL